MLEKHKISFYGSIQIYRLLQYTLVTPTSSIARTRHRSNEKCFARKYNSIPSFPARAKATGMKLELLIALYVLRIRSLIKQEMCTTRLQLNSLLNAQTVEQPQPNYTKSSLKGQKQCESVAHTFHLQVKRCHIAPAHWLRPAAYGTSHEQWPCELLSLSKRPPISRVSLKLTVLLCILVTVSNN